MPQSAYDIKAKETEQIVQEIKEKYPNVRFYYSEIPFCGVYAYKQQDMQVVKEASEAVEKYWADKFKEHDFKDMDEDERREVMIRLEQEANDCANEITLKRCVLYPYNFSQQYDDKNVASGVIPVLLDKIMVISGWHDVEVLEA